MTGLIVPLIIVGYFAAGVTFLVWAVGWDAFKLTMRQPRGIWVWVFWLFFAVAALRG